MINKVTETLDIVKETALTREELGGLETHHKELLVQNLFHEGSEHNHNCRLPNKTNDLMMEELRGTSL